jgi:hypothetical protein
VRSLELELERLLTTGTFNLIVKDPRISALGGRFRMQTAHNHTVLAVVLETYQTYYAVFRAVNPSTFSVMGSTGRPISPLESAKKRVTCRSGLPQAHKVSAHEGTRAFQLVKDLVLEVFGFYHPVKRKTGARRRPVAR